MKDDNIQDYKLGADDYITKYRFVVMYCYLKLKQFLNTTKLHKEEANAGCWANIILIQRLRVDSKRNPALSPKENELLKMLSRNKMIFYREAALKKIWGSDTYF
jgi:DNA-binding response OmpR family regulator